MTIGPDGAHIPEDILSNRWETYGQAQPPLGAAAPAADVLKGATPPVVRWATVRLFYWETEAGQLSCGVRWGRVGSEGGREVGTDRCQNGNGGCEEERGDVTGADVSEPLQALQHVAAQAYRCKRTTPAATDGVSASSRLATLTAYDQSSTGN